MIKRIVALFIICTLLLSGCSQKKETKERDFDDLLEELSDDEIDQLLEKYGSDSKNKADKASSDNAGKVPNQSNNPAETKGEEKDVTDIISSIINGISENNDDASKPQMGEAGKTNGPNVALITDVGNVDDRSYNQAAWEGIKEFCIERGIEHSYYRPTEDSTEARNAATEDAIAKGANVIVCPGYLFEDTVYELQDKYSSVLFLLIDGEPHSRDYSTYKTSKNTLNILFQDEYESFLAGYAVVKEGYTQLCFIGAMDLPPINNYLYGFVQGAEAAAIEKGVTDKVDVKVWYSETFAPTDYIMSKSEDWYSNGTQVIFPCNGGIYLACIAAAEKVGGQVIGCDMDHSYESTTILTSAMRDIAVSVYQALKLIDDQNGKWSDGYAGKTVHWGIQQDCACLPTTNWRFRNFTIGDYQKIYEKLKTGIIEVSAEPDTITNVSIKVDLIE